MEKMCNTTRSLGSVLWEVESLVAMTVIHDAFWEMKFDVYENLTL